MKLQRAGVHDPRSILPLDATIKQKWYPKFISGDWFQVGYNFFSKKIKEGISKAEFQRILL